MNIFDHLIPDEVILGIGPLMTERLSYYEKDPGYYTCRHYFDLHLSSHTTVIRSEWYFLAKYDDAAAKMKAYRDNYFRVRQRVARHIHEEGSESFSHTKKVEHTYRSAETALDHLVAEVPEVKEKLGIKLKVHRIYECLKDLRDLACI